MAAATDRAALLSAEVAPLLVASSSSSSSLVAAPGVDRDGATPGRLLIVIGGGGAGQGRGRSSLAVAVVPPEVTELAAARSRLEGRKRERRGEEINMRRGEEEEIRMIKFEVLRGKRECWGEKKFVQERGIFTCGLLKWLICKNMLIFVYGPLRGPLTKIDFFFMWNSQGAVWENGG
uniref:Uncharacterized protein n=1 Tax=Oryza nivara TaxID=4536 RepID=A0A0E0FKE1_ORYNI